MDLSTCIAGVTFRVGLMNASGALCVTQAELEALGGSDAGAIVTNSNELLATRLDLDRDFGSAGVETVLDQFFDDGCRPLHHLASGDLVDQVTRELANGHGTASGKAESPILSDRAYNL